MSPKKGYDDKKYSKSYDEIDWSKGKEPTTKKKTCKQKKN